MFDNSFCVDNLTLIVVLFRWNKHRIVRLSELQLALEVRLNLGRVSEEVLFALVVLIRVRVHFGGRGGDGKAGDFCFKLLIFLFNSTRAMPHMAKLCIYCSPLAY